MVLGIGGGAALDTAKAIAGLLRSGTGLLDHLEGVGRGLPYPGPALPVVAVPTTAGTGSEATRNAVITERGPHGYKRSFRDERLVPVDAVVDPDLPGLRATVAHRRQRARRADPAARGLHVAAGHALHGRSGPLGARRPRATAC